MGCRWAHPQSVLTPPLQFSIKCTDDLFHCAAKAARGKPPSSTMRTRSLLCLRHIFPSSQVKPFHCFSGVSVACLSLTCQSKHGAGELAETTHAKALRELLAKGEHVALCGTCVPSGPIRSRAPLVLYRKRMIFRKFSSPILQEPSTRKTKSALAALQTERGDREDVKA